MGIRVTRDINNVPRVLQVLEKLQNNAFRVGILSEAEEDMLMIANVHEFGCTIEVTDKMRAYLHKIGIHLKKETTVINIPERSFIRAGFDTNKDKIENRFSQMIEDLINGNIDVDTFYEFMGDYCVGLIQEYMIDLREPALHPVTIQRREKESSNPLIDNGHLKDTITYKIL